jgi:peptide/nickel transport system substrate-binding protein
VIQQIRRGGLPFFLLGWRFENGDAASFLRDCLMTRDAARGSGTYNPGYSNPELDRLIEDNAQMFGDTARLAQYAELMKLALDELPIVPLYHRANLFGVSPRVEWRPRLDGKLLAAEMKLR